ncbi:MAG: type II and III secretion system protein [Planctomycetota bacterium]|nr:type II and III secretion system protein [Planctomycetota bacterium]
MLVLNKQRAELIIGERIGFKTLTVTQTSTVENVQFLNVGTQLRLRPFVTSDGMVRIEIHPERSTGDVINGVPRTRTNEMTSNVMVPDGATIVLAGLIEEEETLGQDGVPGLSRIPWLGALFRRRTTTSLKKELIVLITPRIWTPDLDAGGAIDHSAPALMPMPTADARYNSSRPFTTKPAKRFGKKHVGSNTP